MTRLKFRPVDPAVVDETIDDMLNKPLQDDEIIYQEDGDTVFLQGTCLQFKYFEASGNKACIYFKRKDFERLLAKVLETQTAKKGKKK